MSDDEVQVIPEDLATKATQIRSLTWSTMAAQPSLLPPDALDTSTVAITNLLVNAEAMWQHQEFGRLEGLRLAQTLDNVSAAYADVDKISGEDLDATMGGTGSSSVPDGAVYPRVIDLPAPPHPPKMPIPKGHLVSEQMLFPPEAQRALEAGDDGSSLQAAAQMWHSNAQSLAATAQQFETNSLRWEGAAADVAYAKFTAYRDWLVSLADSWQRLAGEADRMADAHLVAKRDNEPIAEEFERLQQEIAQHPASADNLRKTVQMAALQNQSEEVRHQYVRDGQPDQIQPEDPPSPVGPGVPVTVDDHRRARRQPQDEVPNERPNQGLGAGAAPDGGSPEGGGPQVLTEPPAVSPTAVAEQVAEGAPQGAPSGGSPGGAQQGAGQPGAGSPGGGVPGGGVPNSPTGLPQPLSDPSVRPAASGGRGSGGGGSSGGAGGARPGTGSVLLPSVGAETVAPAPVAAPFVQAAAAGGVMAGGGMGGMGGMAPMMQGAKGEGSGDKKRNPQLSQDEEIYTEDRPWTEPVIGNRVRRRVTPRGMTNDTQKESQ